MAQMPRAGLNAIRVVEEAEMLADEVGIGAVTLAEIAARVGVKVPSLYKHISSLDALQQQISLRARAEFTGLLTRAAVGKSESDALTAIANAYREWARQHPGRYPATLRAPAPTDAEDVATSEQVVQVIYEALSGFGLTGDDAVDATRMLRSSLHGFVSLEAAGGFGLPRDVDRSFERMVSALESSLRNWPST
jgi:AcrR family transcriptional regulator